MREEIPGSHRGIDDAVTNEIIRLSLSRGLDGAKPLPAVVADSWKRCFTDHQLIPDRVPRAQVITHSEMCNLSETHQDLLQVAGPEVEKLFLRLVDSEYLVSLASPEGVMMLFRCDNHFLGDMSHFGVLPGSVWNEERQGTNGVGTCLRVGKPVTIVGNQHYGVGVQSLTCLVAPVLGKFGAVESVLNVTTPRSGDERTNRVVQDIVERTARRIENRYFGRLYKKNNILRLSEDREDVDVSEEGRLAVDDNGLIVAGTSYLSRITGHSAENLLGRQVEDVFDMGVRLCDIAPDKPVSFLVKGKTVHAAFTNASTRATQQKATHIVSAFTPVHEASNAIALYRNITLPEPRLDPMTAMSLGRAQKLLEAGLSLVIKGESGIGKTTFAQIAARRSFGENGAIVEVDCTSATRETVASAAGHASATVAPGVLILDRIDELDETAQSALLAVIESNLQFSTGRVGLIAVTSADLEQVMRDGAFRTDLYHRLNGATIELQPLRNRPDLDSAISDFLKLELAAQGKPVLILDEEARLILANYHWPGNTRELRQALRHAIALTDGKSIGLSQLPAEMVSEIGRKDLTARSQAQASRIEAALRFNGGNVSTTARHLGVSRATLYRKIQIQKLREEAKEDLSDDLR
jgi:sigma-54 dependent transcriptional regulator, acetoin dehydrogenase operon transcriptional activator AcoR